MTPYRYRSHDEDSARWRALEHRPGDVVVSTRSKHGTTWTQTLCLMLSLGKARLPRPLAELSPWVDWLTEPLEEVLARVAGQRHQRVLKTHTPLDGLPWDERVRYVVVARDPLDAAVSLFHHSRNIDRTTLARLTGQPSPAPGATDIREWLPRWVDADVARPQQHLDSLAGVLWHLADAWRRRSAENLLLLHYDDMSEDRARVVARLAQHLGVDAGPELVAAVVAASSFEAMRERSADLAPDQLGVLRDRSAFFRGGRSGEGQSLVAPEVLQRYRDRVRASAPAGLAPWLLREPSTPH